MTGQLTTFIVEPFLPHPPETEYYVCINSSREGDHILFTHEGGINIGDVDAKVRTLSLPVTAPHPSRAAIASALLHGVPEAKRDVLVDFIVRLYAVYVHLHFTYLEINPLVCLDGKDRGPPSVHYLDMAAKLDQTAESICGDKWAIPRDLSQYEPSASAGGATTKGSQINVYRGPPMARSSIFLINNQN